MKSNAPFFFLKHIVMSLRFRGNHAPLTFKVCLLAAITVALLSACNSDVEMTPETDTTDLWPAGITRNFYLTTAKYGYINRKGKMVIKPEYSEAGSFSCGYAPVRYDSLFTAKINGTDYTEYRPIYGFVGKHGKFHRAKGEVFNIGYHGNLSPFYNNASVFTVSFSDGFLPFASMINKNFNVVFSESGKMAPMSADGLAVLYKPGIVSRCVLKNEEGQKSYVNFQEFHFYDITGRKVMDLTNRYDVIPQFKDGYATYTHFDCSDKDTIDGNEVLRTPSYIIDKKGHIIHEDEYPMINLGHQMFHRIYMDENDEVTKTELIDKHGNVYGSPKFSAPALSEDMQFLRSYYDKNMGIFIYYYVNQLGEQTIPRKFVAAGDFYEGYAVVKYVPGLQEKHDSTENYEQFYEYIENAHNQIIDKTGKTVLIIEDCKTVTRVHNGLVLTYKLGLNERRNRTETYKYIDLTGKEIYSWEVYYDPYEQSSEEDTENQSNIPAYDNVNTKGGIKIYPNGLYVLGAQDLTPDDVKPEDRCPSVFE